jgi:acetyl-CoA carboxylase biotin carboxyl carrier protein
MPQRSVIRKGGTEKAMSVEITAPMPGKIASIQVSVGSQVKEEEEIIIMDAMKMEIPVYAPQAGSVQEIKVKVGDSVNEGQVLAILE